ncbi:MAG: anti-sigma factor [Alphaproteobacteria bacterium]|nr:anti-sigma factor [Alphaproteobacteria bacterium]
MTNNLSDKDEILASEYAMGLLEGEAKQSAEKRFDNDLEFRNLVEDWQARLNPLLNEVAEAKPSGKVWNAIEAELMPSEKTSIWASLNFWRGLSIASSAIAVIAIAFIISTANVSKNQQVLVASLTATGDAPAFLAKFNSQTGALVINAGFAQDQDAKVAELWLIPADGVPRSLGLLDADGQAKLLVTAELKNNFAKDGTLAVSLEPLGGSPTGAPTGPVIASGKLQFL